MADYGLVSLREVKQFYFSNDTNSKTQDDDLLEVLIDRITTQFINYCGVTSFFANDYIEYYDTCGSLIVSKNSPINTITFIYNDPDWNWNNDSLIDSADYKVFHDKQIVFKYGFSKSIGSFKLSYNAGYDVIPGDLKHACIKEVAREYKHRKDFDIVSGNKEESGSSESNTYLENGLMKSTLQILSKYKTLRVF